MSQEKSASEIQRDKVKQAFHEERRRRVAVGVEQMTASPEGRALLWEILNASHVFGDCYAASPTDTAYNLGARSVGLNLLNLALPAHSELLSLLTKENTCPIK